MRPSCREIPGLIILISLHRRSKPRIEKPKGPALMKSILGTSPAKKTMRVATAFTGVAATAFAGVAAFAPGAKANSQVHYPYVLWVKTSTLVTSIQVCGYKDVGTGEWYCTEREAN